jgi:hypothetical protein
MLQSEDVKQNLTDNETGDTSWFEDVTSNFNILLVAIGIIDNIISISVLVNKKLRERKFNLYLLVLAIIELIYCLTVFIDYTFRKLFNQPIFLSEYSNTSRIIIDYIIHTSDSCTVLMVLFLTIDRLYAIKNPMKIKQFITNLHAKKLISISLVVLIFIKTSSFAFCELNVNHNAYLIYCAIASPLIFNILPLIIVLVLNVVLIKEVTANFKKKTCIAMHLSQFSSSKYESKSRLNQSREHYGSILSTVTIKTGQNKFRSNEVDTNNIRLLFRSKKFYHNNETTFEDIEDVSNKTNVHSLESIGTFNRKRICQTQKSHYIIILTTSMWSMLTSLFYYTNTTFYLILQVKFNKNFEILKKLTMIQLFSSVLFNSNHFINFFIYIIFYADFRAILKNYLLKVFCKSKSPLQTV